MLGARFFYVKTFFSFFGVGRGRRDRSRFGEGFFSCRNGLGGRYFDVIRSYSLRLFCFL